MYILSTFRTNLFLPGLQPAWGLCVAPWIDNGNMFSVQGGSFSLSPFHPPRRGESKGGSWKWPCHMGNNSTLRSERTHKRPHYLQHYCWPACEQTESRCASTGHRTELLSVCCIWCSFCLEIFLTHNTACSVILQPKSQEINTAWWLQK